MVSRASSIARRTARCSATLARAGARRGWCDMGGEIECAARQTLELRRSTNRAKKDRTGAGRKPAAMSWRGSRGDGTRRDGRCSRCSVLSRRATATSRIRRDGPDRMSPGGPCAAWTPRPEPPRMGLRRPAGGYPVWGRPVDACDEFRQRNAATRSTARLRREPPQRFFVLLAGVLDHVRRQLRARCGLVPVEGFEVIAHELFVERRRAGARRVRVHRPEA